MVPAYAIYRNFLAAYNSNPSFSATSERIVLPQQNPVFGLVFVLPAPWLLLLVWNPLRRASPQGNGAATLPGRIFFIGTERKEPTEPQQFYGFFIFAALKRA